MPTLSFSGMSAYEWKLLIVLDPPLPFKGLTRRGAFIRHLGATLLRIYAELPGPGTVARGVVCEPVRLQEAVDAFWAAGHDVTRPPIAPADLTYLKEPSSPWRR